MVKLVAFVSHKSDVSFEHFDNYWANTHGGLFASLKAVRDGTVKYSQFHVNRALTAPLGQHLPLAETQGFAIFEAEKLETILALFASEEYQSLVLPDEEALGIDRAGTRVVILDEYIPVPTEKHTPEIAYKPSTGA